MACRRTRGPGWSRPGASRPSTAFAGAARFDAIDGRRRAGRSDRRRERGDLGRRGHRGRSAAPHLHLLPSGAGAGRAGRAHAARSVRAHDRGDRPGVPDAPHRRWPSASCAPRRRSAMRAFRTRCRRRTSCRSGSDSVLRVIYLVFNEGYSASSGASLTRLDLSGEAIRLGRLLVELLPEPEAIGLLALMLLHESRRAARASPTGELILLDDQDRSLWNRGPDRRRLGAGGTRACVAGASARTRFRRRSPPSTPSAATADATDWGQIVGTLRRAAARRTVAGRRAEPRRGRRHAGRSRRGPRADRRDPGAAANSLDYHLAHAARADLCRRLGRMDEARVAYTHALALARQEPERRFLERRLAELPG